MKNLTKIENGKDITTKEYLEANKLKLVGGDNISITEDGNTFTISSVNASITSWTTSDGWYIRRFSDGYIEMMFTYIVTGATWREEPYGWYYVVATKGALPITLVAKLDESISMMDLNASRLTFGLPASGGTLSMRPTLVAYLLEDPNGLTDFTYVYKISGRWK